MLLTNLRQALLRLVHAPLFTIIAILTLTLGIGANTAIFSVVQGVLLHPAGVEDPASLISFHARYTQLNLPSIGVSAPDQADAASLSSLVSSSRHVCPAELQRAAGRPHAPSARRAGHLALVPHLWRATHPRPHLPAGRRSEGRQPASSCSATAHGSVSSADSTTPSASPSFSTASPIA